MAKKFRGAGLKNEDNIASVLWLNHIIENANKLGTFPNKHGKDTPFTDYLTRFSIGRRNYSILLHIKNAKQGDRHHYHILDRIEMDPAYGSNGADSTGTYQETESISSTPSIASPTTEGKAQFNPGAENHALYGNGQMPGAQETRPGPISKCFFFVFHLIFNWQWLHFSGKCKNLGLNGLRNNLTHLGHLKTTKLKKVFSTINMATKIYINVLFIKEKSIKNIIKHSCKTI